jgi:hypothetical protein
MFVRVALPRGLPFLLPPLLGLPEFYLNLFPQGVALIIETTGTDIMHFKYYNLPVLATSGRDGSGSLFELKPADEQAFWATGGSPTKDL